MRFRRVNQQVLAAGDQSSMVAAGALTRAPRALSVLPSAHRRDPVIGFPEAASVSRSDQLPVPATRSSSTRYERAVATFINRRRSLLPVETKPLRS